MSVYDKVYYNSYHQDNIEEFKGLLCLEECKWDVGVTVYFGNLASGEEPYIDYFEILSGVSLCDIVDYVLDFCGGSTVRGDGFIFAELEGDFVCDVFCSLGRHRMVFRDEGSDSSMSECISCLLEGNSQ